MFQVGDIVRGKNNFSRYIVTGVDSYLGRAYWRGISTNGITQGGTIFGNERFDDYVVIGHFDLEPMYSAISEAFKEDYIARYGEEKWRSLSRDLKH